MIQGIDPISANMRLAQLLGEESITAPAAAPLMAGENFATPKVNFTGNAFEDLLAKATEALAGVSKSEAAANQAITGYIQGTVDLQEAMVAQSKASVMSQLAVTTVNAAVNTFKEVTQMQI
jgi:flagellar hook-basal body complex protein FliE